MRYGVADKKRANWWNKVDAIFSQLMIVICLYQWAERTQKRVMRSDVMKPLVIPPTFDVQRVTLLSDTAEAGKWRW